MHSLQRTGNRPFMQSPRGQFFCRGRVPLPPPLPLEPALEETFTFLSPSCIVASDRPWTTLSTRMPINKIWRRTEPTPRSRWWRNHVAGIYSDCAALAHGLNSTQLTDLTQTELNWTLEFLGSAIRHASTVIFPLKMDKFRLSQTNQRDGLRYDTRYYFNVRSKADISQLNLPHGTDN